MRHHLAVGSLLSDASWVTSTESGTQETGGDGVETN